MNDAFYVQSGSYYIQFFRKKTFKIYSIKKMYFHFSYDKLTIIREFHSFRNQRNCFREKSHT